MTIHRDLRRILVPSGLISAGCAVFGWIGLIRPGILGWGLSIPPIVKAMLFILGCMPILWFLGFRLHLRSLWVYRHVKPVTMSARVEVEEEGDHTSYYVLLESPVDNTQLEHIPVYPPQWDARSVMAGSIARVFKDPVSGRPMVIEIEGRCLWSMAL